MICMCLSMDQMLDTNTGKCVNCGGQLDSIPVDEWGRPRTKVTVPTVASIVLGPDALEPIKIHAGTSWSELWEGFPVDLEFNSELENFQGSAYAQLVDPEAASITICTPWVRRGFYSAELHTTKDTEKRLKISIIAKMHFANDYWQCTVFLVDGETKCFQSLTAKRARMAVRDVIKESWGKYYEIEYVRSGKT